MTTEIKDLRFVDGYNQKYDIHECSSSDGVNDCAYGLPVKNYDYTQKDHKNYYGVSVGQFGRDGCAVVSGGKGINCDGSACCRGRGRLEVMVKIREFLRGINLHRQYTNAEHIACIEDTECVCCLFQKFKEKTNQNI